MRFLTHLKPDGWQCPTLPCYRRRPFKIKGPLQPAFPANPHHTLCPNFKRDSILPLNPSVSSLWEFLLVHFVTSPQRLPVPISHPSTYPIHVLLHQPLRPPIPTSNPQSQTYSRMASVTLSTVSAILPTSTKTSFPTSSLSIHHPSSNGALSISF